MNFTKTAIATAVIASVIGLAGCNDDDDNTSPSVDTSNLKYVDPFIGTGFNGHTFRVLLCQRAWCNFLQIPS